ncbi:membrane metallo-endopeptidase-like 1 [Rhipicephalus microplus]|uniref:membrane metallo-endopeptidase-like 1 n=1 Tax=Rhipicephalus microplus TaxID=6941 RepID=UPI003F6CC794
MDAELKEQSEEKYPTGQSSGVRSGATTPAASSEASSRGSRATTDSSTNTSGVKSRDGHTDGTSETNSSETTSSYDSHGTPHDFEEPHVVAVDVGDDVEVAPWCEPCGSTAVAALALLAAFMITVVFMTLRALYGYDVEMTANDIDEEPTLSFLRLPEGEPAIMAIGNHDETGRPVPVTPRTTNETTIKLALNNSADINETTMFSVRRIQIGSDDQILPLYSGSTTRRPPMIRIMRKRVKRPSVSKIVSRNTSSGVAFFELKDFTRRPVNVQLVAKTSTLTPDELGWPTFTPETIRGKAIKHSFNEKRTLRRIDSVHVGSDQGHKSGRLSTLTAALLPWKKPSWKGKAASSLGDANYEEKSALMTTMRFDGTHHSSETSVNFTEGQPHQLQVIKTSKLIYSYQNDYNETREKKMRQDIVATTECSSQECVIASALNAHIIPNEVDPCEDFQLHVCGGQARSHGIYNRIEDEALNTLKALLESSSLPRTGHMATQKAVTLFRACVRFSKDGLAMELPKVRHFLESLGLNLTGQLGQVAKDTMDNPVLPMLRLSLQYALHTFVAFHIDGLNVVNGKKIMRIVVSRADQDWFEERWTLSEQEKKDYYAGVLLVYEAKPLRPEIVMLIPDIANFESQAFKKLVEQRRIPKKYKSSFIRLENLGTYAHWYGQPDEWHDQLQQLSLFAYGANDTAHSSSAALEQLKLITQPESWLKGRQLICWSLIRQMIGFGRNPLLAILPESAFTTQCIRKVSEVMEPAIQGLLLFKQFTPEVRAQLEVIARVVLETIAKHLNERGNTSRHWDDSNRLQALRRLATMQLAIGFPDNIRVEADLEAIYGSFPKAKRTFWEAWISSANIVQRRTLERVGQPDVQFKASVMGAAYSPCLNKLVIPAGIARPPFLISNGPPSYNYAAIGMIIFHALFHGDYSLEARGIDAMTPDCKNWWTPTAQYYYKQASRCRTTQPPELGEDYAFIPNLNIDSELLHVLAATSASYEAFRALPASQRNGVLPTLNYTAEQLFFVVNCALRCCDAKANRAADDNSFCEAGISSCAMSSGCNSVAKRMPEFAAAFHCAAGSKMNPRDTCAL